MASEEHKHLADFIKTVHHNLRHQSNEVGVQEAWRSHCSEQDTLGRYAVAMKRLATEFWDPNAEDENNKAQSRIEWVAARSHEYFMTEAKMKQRQTEDRKWIAYKKSQNSCVDSEEESLSETTQIEEEFNQSTTLYVLDVGSCYNPFKIYPYFNVVPIDIAPACEDVYECDFLNVGISSGSTTVLKGSPITELTECSFDIVVFSLLLEYMPTPEQRYQCCLKAYKLLKTGGLLFIITPDSKNPSANAPLMKNWRISLSQIAFSRVYYEKLAHIHCMAYRKAAHAEFAQCLWRRTNLDEVSVEQLMKIPQDFRDYVSKSNTPSIIRTDVDDEISLNLFSELPLED